MTDPKQIPDISLEDISFLLSLARAQSLTLTAAEMQMSMGAASRRLSRLREALHDELFVRSGPQMIPTKSMKEMLPKMKNVLDAAKLILETEHFDLSTTRRVVKILSVDNGILTLLRDAIGRLYQSSPHISMSVQPITERLFDDLRAGEADMALFPAKAVPKDIHKLELYRSRRGILVKSGHPLIELYEKKGKLDLEDLAGYRRIETNAPGGQSWSGIAKDSAMLSEVQETGFSMPYFLAVPYVLTQTNFTYMAPVITLMHFVRMPEFNLRMLPAPAPLATYTPCLIWHQSTHEEPFLQWVRCVITDTSRSSAKRFGVLAD